MDLIEFTPGATCHLGTTRPLPAGSMQQKVIDATRGREDSLLDTEVTMSSALAAVMQTTNGNDNDKDEEACEKNLQPPAQKTLTEVVACNTSSLRPTASEWTPSLRPTAPEWTPSTQTKTLKPQTLDPSTGAALGNLEVATQSKLAQTPVDVPEILKPVAYVQPANKALIPSKALMERSPQKGYIGHGTASQALTPAGAQMGGMAQSPQKGHISYGTASQAEEPPIETTHLNQLLYDHKKSIMRQVKTAQTNNTDIIEILRADFCGGVDSEIKDLAGSQLQDLTQLIVEELNFMTDTYAPAAMKQLLGLNVANSKKKEEIILLAAQIEVMRKYEEGLQADLKKAQKWQDAETSRDTLRMELNQVKEKLPRVDTGRKALCTDNKLLRRDSTALDVEVQDLKAEVQRLQGDNNRLRVLRAGSQPPQDVASEVQRLRDECQRLQGLHTENRRLCIDIQRLQNKNHHLCATKEKTDKQTSQITHERDVYKAFAFTVGGDIGYLQQSLGTLKM